MAEMIAEFVCDTVTHARGPREEVVLRAVTDTDPAGDDSDFAEASPYGKLELTIDNEEAHGYFAPGDKYYLGFTRADDE